MEGKGRETDSREFRRKDQQAEKDQTERVTGLGRRTGEEIAKWNQVTALRFQTGERHQISPASLRGGGGGICIKDSEKLLMREMIVSSFFARQDFA